MNPVRLLARRSQKRQFARTPPAREDRINALRRKKFR
jgi:hypothetical protein